MKRIRNNLHDFFEVLSLLWQVPNQNNTHHTHTSYYPNDNTAYPDIDNIRLEEITSLLQDDARRSAMRKALFSMAVPDSAERLCAVMENLAKTKERKNGHQG